MKRRLCALFLTLALGLSVPALAAEDVAARFPASNPYAGFSDVVGDPWFAASVRVCAETGLMTGTGSGVFSPFGTVNVAQAVTMAVRIHDILAGGDGVIESPAGEPWYTGAVEIGTRLAREAGDNRLLSRLSFPDSPATRADFFGFLTLAVEDSLLAPINAITWLPDTDDAAVLAFYNAGILTGKNAYGSFRPNDSLQRAEAAAMMARLVRPALRESFTPLEVPPLCRAAGVLPDTLFFPGVTALDYLTQAVAVIGELEALCAAQEVEFNWQNTVDGQSFSQYVTAQTAAALHVAAGDGTDACRALDLQVFYSRWLDLNQG